MCVTMEQLIFDVFSCTYAIPTPQKNNGIIDNIMAEATIVMIINISAIPIYLKSVIFIFFMLAAILFL